MTTERLAELARRYGSLTPDAYAHDHPATHAAELLAEVKRLNGELANAQERLQWLAALEAAGVDNWQGYDVAREISREADEPQQHTYAVEVFHLENNPHFGTGWTWSKVIDGIEDDFVPDLPHCADEADARAKAAAWLAEEAGR